MQALMALFLSSIFVLATTHILALKFYLYWTYLWLDMPVHILGGICVAFGFSILPYFRIHISEKFQTLGTYLIVVLIVGILWELFEFLNGISLVADDDFMLDTVVDLVLDLAGGAFGYYLVTRIKNL